MLKSNEIARGVAIGTSGQTLGLGLGYLLPAVIVTNQHVTNCQNVTNKESENSVEKKDQIDFVLMNFELFWLNLRLVFSLSDWPVLSWSKHQFENLS